MDATAVNVKVVETHVVDKALSAGPIGGQRIAAVVVPSCCWSGRGASSCNSLHHLAGLGTEAGGIFVELEGHRGADLQLFSSSYDIFDV